MTINETISSSRRDTLLVRIIRKDSLFPPFFVALILKRKRKDAVE